MRYREDKKGHFVRKYDKPKTPYQRVLESGILTKEKEIELKKLFSKLNPAELMRQITVLQTRLIETTKEAPDNEPKQLSMTKLLLDSAA